MDKIHLQLIHKRTELLGNLEKNKNFISNKQKKMELKAKEGEEGKERSFELNKKNIILENSLMKNFLICITLLETCSRIKFILKFICFVL